MHQSERVIAGLRTIVSGDLNSAKQVVVLMHGYTMRPEDLAPFTLTLSANATAYVLPQAPLSAISGGYTWWPINEQARAKELEQGPRDLFNASPTGLPAARAAISALLAEVLGLAPQAQLILGGFSQGGMLACDLSLRRSLPIRALFMLSASMIDHHQWSPLLPAMQGMPVLLSHGRADQNLAFSAGERLRDALLENGAQLTWVPFDGEHQIPLTVWRQLRKFLQTQAL